MDLVNETINAQPQNGVLNSPKDLNKRLKKEEKLKEIKRYCNQMKLSNNTSCKRLNERTKHHAREFVKKCKSSLSEDQFKELLIILVNFNYFTQNKTPSKDFLLNYLNKIFKIIKANNDLKSRFSAFLTCENALQFDLFDDALQYEKTSEFLVTLEVIKYNLYTFSFNYRFKFFFLFDNIDVYAKQVF